jgi:hypothetical protein
LLEQLAAGDAAAANPEPLLGARAYGRIVDELSSTGVQLEDGPDVTLAEVVAVADERGWVFRESGRILSLPVDQTRYVQTNAFQLEAALRRYQ